MAKTREHRCGTCAYAEWPKNKAGHRLKKNSVAYCLCPIPELPLSVEEPIVKRNVLVEGGIDCPKWLDETSFEDSDCLGHPHDATNEGCSIHYRR